MTDIDLKKPAPLRDLLPAMKECLAQMADTLGPHWSEDRCGIGASADDKRWKVCYGELCIEHRDVLVALRALAAAVHAVRGDLVDD